MKHLLLIMALFFSSSGVYADEAAELQHQIQTRWSEIKYNTATKLQEDAFKQLAEYADSAVERYPQSAELLIWKGIVLSTYAGAKGGLGALSLVTDAKASLERAIELKPMALGGSAYTSLGALYYQVPGWPLSFGDDEIAEKLLVKALDINPDGIDSNFFYGDFLISQKKYDLARGVLEHALQAQDRPGREIADNGRRAEVQALLSKL